MPKFFVKQEQIKENKEIQISGEDVKHIGKVLRAKIGEEIIICNQDTSENFLCSILKITSEVVLAKIEKTIESKAEPNIYIHLFQGLPKADKMEWIIEKGVEVGISEFTPIRMKNCIAKVEQKEEKKKVERWQKISEVAAKQSSRDRIPKMNQIRKF